MMVRTLLVIAVLTLGFRCGSTGPVDDLSDELRELDFDTMDGTISGEGKVVWNAFEGGFYGIVADDGKEYYPLSPLADEFRQNGLRVTFEIKVRNDVATIVMWGQPVDLITIARS